MKIGSNVIVKRQIGENGIPNSTKGIIVRFNQTITVKDKPTVVVKFDDDKETYFFPIDEIEVVS